MKKISKLLLGGLLLLLPLSACSDKKTTTNTADGKLKVVTTFYPMYDFTKNVAGNQADITMLIDGTVEPHDYEPSAKDIAKIEDADVFVYNSKEMETWVPKVLENINKKKVTVIDASKGIDLMEGNGHSHDHEAEDEVIQEHHAFHVHGTKDHYHTGDKVVLEAHDSDKQDFDHYQWFEKKEGAKDYTPIKEETSETYEFTVKEPMELKVKLMDKNNQVIDETEAIPVVINDHHEEKKEEDHGHSHAYDPHIWLDPVLAIKEVENIRDGLSKADAKNKATFEKNAASFIKQLEELNQEYEDAFKGAKNRVFVTQHAAFGYLARQYHLTQEPISGISPDMEPSASQLAEIENFVKEHDVKVIYTEELSSSKIAETIAKATGAKMETLNTLEGLTEQEQKDGQNYLTVMKENLEALKQSIK